MKNNTYYIRNCGGNKKIGGSAKQISSLQDYVNKKKFPKKLSSYLLEIKKILEENKDNLYLAQEKIEAKWLEIASQAFEVKSELYKREKWIFDSALDFLKEYHRKGNLRRKFKNIAEFLVDHKYVMLAFSFIIMFYSKTGQTDIASKIGRNIVYNIYKEKFKKDNITYSKFESSNGMDNIFYIKLGSLFIDIFTSQAILEIFEKRFDTDRIELQISKKFEDEIRNSLIIYPQTLPMVVKPKIWSNNSLGGFLENKEDNNAKGLISGSENHNHQIIFKDNIYKAINYLNGLEYRINTDLLDYLENEGDFIIEEIKRRNPKSYFSTLITLDVARTYRNVPIYLNVNLDWRGRIYTQSFYLDYQGSDLSAALINLCKGEKLTEKGKFFFFIYGANCYNFNNMQKRKFEERYNWVIKNLDQIYGMDKDFILKAESPALFAAFCISMKKMKDNPDYLHYSPVSLDATCSGIQHFAAMLADISLAKEVNLIANEEVKDIYQKLVEPINNSIIKECQNDFNLNRLVDISLTRKELKSIIMTKAYNVTTFGIIEQLKSALEKVEEQIIKDDKKITIKKYKVPAKNSDGFLILNENEVNKIGKIINDNIFNQFPSLYSIYKFFTDMAKIMIKLGIPISWATPAGLEIAQHYVTSEIKKININFLGKNKTAVLREWKKDTIDTRKQVQALIPNIVHSLDASHLINVINRLNNTYILPVHDCFGTHPNDMDALADIVRFEFINLYTKETFLMTLYNKFLIDVKAYGFEIKEKDNTKYIEIKKRKIEKIILPNLPEKGTLDLFEISKSKYMIC